MCLRQMKLKGSPSVYRKHQVRILDCQAAVTGWQLGRFSSIFPQPGLRIGLDIGSIVGGKGQKCRWSAIVDCGLLMVILSEICQGKSASMWVLGLVALTDFAAVSHNGDT